MNDASISLVRVALATTVVAGLLVALAWILKTWARGSLSFGKVSLGMILAPRTRRLWVQDSLVLDARRRIVIVRVDACEHVVLLGANGETVLAKGSTCAQDSYSLSCASKDARVDHA